MRIVDIYPKILLLILCMLLLKSDGLPPGDKVEQVRAYTRMIEFDYATWMVDALIFKNAQAAVSPENYLPDSKQSDLVEDCLKWTRELDEVRGKIEQIYSDPTIKEPGEAAAESVHKRDNLLEQQNRFGPVCESILQQQTSAVLRDFSLTLGGQPVPPVLYRVSQMPLALIVSPREKIQQEANISLVAGMTLEEIIALEKSVEEGGKNSALVEEIGGVGVYPTMVMSTDNIEYLTELIAHEWTHNYLTLRPLGMNYETSPELRTMNETAASIAGVEIGRAVLERYYPEFLPKPSPPQASSGKALEKPAEPPKKKFNFREEMHITRVRADELLAEGRIEEAENYMEARRQYLWDHGYHIRRLNQAYFAFHGAYADQPGGAEGKKDPVGPMVRALRKKSTSLADFLNRISWMTSLDDLFKAAGGKG